MKSYITKYDSNGSEVFTAWLTYSGSATAAAIDRDGDIYVVGISDDPRLPLSEKFPNGAGKGFILKLSADGSTLLWAGRFNAFPYAVAINSKGELWIGGETDIYSPGNPPLMNPLQERKNGAATCGGIGPNLFACPTGFVAKVNAQGSAFSFFSYLGGSYRDSVRGIVIDSADDVYLTGIRYSSDFPLTAPANTASPGGIFIMKLHGDLPSVVYSVPFGGRTTFNDQNVGAEAPAGIAIDSFNRLAIAGSTTFSDFGISSLPRSDKTVVCDSAANGAKQECPAAFVLRVDASTGVRTAFTGLPASGSTSVKQLALDSAGVAHVTGSTDATNFPVTDNASQVCNAGSYSTAGAASFVAEIASDGSILYSTYAGSANDSGTAWLLYQPDGSVRALVSVNGSEIRPGSGVPLARSLAVQCVVNAANQRTGVSFGAIVNVSPGEHVSLFGQFSTSGTESIQVLFDKFPASLLSATNTRIDLIVPKEIASLQSCVLSGLSAFSGHEPRLSGI